VFPLAWSWRCLLLIRVFLSKVSNKADLRNPSAIVRGRLRGVKMNNKAALIAHNILLERTSLLKVLTAPGWSEGDSEGYHEAKKNALLWLYVHIVMPLEAPPDGSEQAAMKKLFDGVDFSVFASR
jgi:hypothetical protein